MTNSILPGTISALASALLQTCKSISCNKPKQIAAKALYTLKPPKSFMLKGILFTEKFIPVSEIFTLAALINLQFSIFNLQFIP